MGNGLWVMGMGPGQVGALGRCPSCPGSGPGLRAWRVVNSSICTGFGLSAHFLYVRGLPFSQFMYKPINEF